MTLSTIGASGVSFSRVAGKRIDTHRMSGLVYGLADVKLHFLAVKVHYN